MAELTPKQLINRLIQIAGLENCDPKYLEDPDVKKLLSNERAFRFAVEHHLNPKIAYHPDFAEERRLFIDIIEQSKELSVFDPNKLSPEIASLYKAVNNGMDIIKLTQHDMVVTFLEKYGLDPQIAHSSGSVPSSQRHGIIELTSDEKKVQKLDAVLKLSGHKFTAENINELYKLNLPEHLLKEKEVATALFQPYDKFRAAVAKYINSNVETTLDLTGGKQNERGK